MPKKKSSRSTDTVSTDLSRGQTLATMLARCVEEGDCLIWQGYMALRNTPMVSHKRRMYGSRRVIAFLSGHPMAHRDDGMWGAKCGTLGCCAPDHLVFRTYSQQAKHMAKSATKLSMKLRCLKVSQKADRKIPLEDIESIRSSTESASVLVARYGCSKSLIIKYRKLPHITQTVGPWAGLF